MQKAAVLFALLLSITTPPVRGAPRGDMSETSGDESPGLDLDPASWKLELLTGGLVSQINSLRDEQAAQFSADWLKGNKASYDDYKMHLPHLLRDDGCFSHRFNSRRCLNRIVGVLQLYRPHLESLKKEHPASSKVHDLVSRTETLTQILKEKLMNARVEVSDSSMQDLPHDMAKSEWERKIRVHVILSEFGVFMAETHRAIRFISRHLGK